MTVRPLQTSPGNCVHRSNSLGLQCFILDECRKISLLFFSLLRWRRNLCGCMNFHIPQLQRYFGSIWTNATGDEWLRLDTRDIFESKTPVTLEQLTHIVLPERRCWYQDDKTKDEQNKSQCPYNHDCIASCSCLQYGTYFWIIILSRS